MRHYYTIRIPFVPREMATEWHPTEASGPFKVLARGAFRTIEDAVTWARTKLGGTPYSIHYTDDSGTRQGHLPSDPPLWKEGPE